ncbi:MAG: hypothetical protein ABIH00_03010 [Armatimonadota bacterium]
MKKNLDLNGIFNTEDITQKLVNHINIDGKSYDISGLTMEERASLRTYLDKFCSLKDGFLLPLEQREIRKEDLALYVKPLKEKLSLAVNTKDPGELETLSNDGSTDKNGRQVVKIKVISNQCTPPEVLTELSFQLDRDIVLALAGNENTPGEVLARLHKLYIYNEQIKNMIENNPNYKKR